MSHSFPTRRSSDRDSAKSAFLLVRLSKLLLNDVHFRRCNGLIIANACQAEQIGRKLRTFGMEDERPAHAENPTEKASFEHDIVSGRSQTRLQCGCWRAGGDRKSTRLNSSH